MALEEKADSDGKERRRNDKFYGLGADGNDLVQLIR